MSQLKNQANLTNANTSFLAKFDETFNATAPGSWSQYTEVIASSGEATELVFASFLGAMREWLGAKEFMASEAWKLNIPFRKYEMSLALPRQKVVYDLTGAVPRMIGQFVDQAYTNSTDKIMIDALVSNSGAGPVGFDGANLISDTHTLGSTSQDNKITTALSFSTYDGGIQAMQGFQGANGEPLNIFPTHLMVGPKLRKMGMEITKSTERLMAVDNAGVETGTRVAASTIPNIYGGGAVDLIVNPRLVGTQDDYWYLMDLSKSSKPLVLAQQRDWTAVVKQDDDDDARFNLDLFQWSIEGDMSPHAGAWPLIYGGIL